MDDLSENITMYGLSTCMWCKKTVKLLDGMDIKYTLYYVNELKGDEQERAKEKVAQLNPSKSYPTISVDDEVIVGYKPEKIEKAVEACRQRKKSTQ
jgi:glutaredoxin